MINTNYYTDSDPQAIHPTVCPLKIQYQLLQEVVCDSTMHSKKSTRNNIPSTNFCGYIFRENFSIFFKLSAVLWQ